MLFMHCFNLLGNESIKAFIVLKEKLFQTVNIFWDKWLTFFGQYFCILWPIIAQII